MENVGIIVIGKNEGDRLRRCLASVLRHGLPTVYVDSRSTDGSAELARDLGAHVSVLMPTETPTAALARNRGFEEITRVAPDLEYVLFIDGDCELVDDWLRRSLQELERHPDTAIACGRRRERHPEKSLYNALADIEWIKPLGEVAQCGGDFTARRSSFETVGGFDPTLVAGEEPELCRRIRMHGWKVVRLDSEMTVHDSEMLHFTQWFKRGIRSGYGTMDLALRQRFNDDPVRVGGVAGSWIWAVGWPLAVVLAVARYTRRPSGSRAATAWVAVAAFPAQVVRLAVSVRGQTPDAPTAVAFGLMTTLVKVPHLIGQVKRLLTRVQPTSAPTSRQPVAARLDGHPRR